MQNVPSREATQTSQDCLPENTHLQQGVQSFLRIRTATTLMGAFVDAVMWTIMIIGRHSLSLDYMERTNPEI